MKQVTLGGLTVRLAGGTDGEGGGSGPLVVLMHGFAAPGDDLVPFAKALEVPAEVRFAFPEGAAPLPRQYGGEARAWWMIDVNRLELVALSGDTEVFTEVEPDGLDVARNQLVNCLDELEETLAPSTVVLGGFSQGAMLACDTVLRTPRKFDGLVMLSGAMVAGPVWRPLMASRGDLAVFMSHGEEDPILPYAIADQLRSELNDAGLNVMWVPFRGGHQIPSNVVGGLSHFLQSVL